MIGLFATTTAGRRAASDLAARLGSDALLVDGRLEPALRRMWTMLDSAVFFLEPATAVRLVAPMLRDEHADPGVVCVDEGLRFAVALAGGHSGGANALAQQVAEVLDCTPVTTADSAASTPLDEITDQLDAIVDGDLDACRAAMLDGQPVRLVNPHGFPLPALTYRVGTDVDNPVWTVVIDDRRPGADDPEQTVRIIPRTLVVGIGASRGVSRTAVTGLLAALDTEHDLDPRAVRAFATVEGRAEEHGVVEAVQDMGFWYSEEGGDELPLLTYPAEALDSVEVPNPSDAVRAAAGTASVAEAAALVGARELGGGCVELVAPKRRGEGVTVAAARLLPRGRLAVVGLGPGDPDLRTPRAEAELRRAGVLVGPEGGLDQVRHLLRFGTEVRPSSPGADLVAEALKLARSGRAVALVVPGDARAEADACREHSGSGVELVIVPGVAARCSREGQGRF